MSKSHCKLTALLFLLTPALVFSHGGRLDSNGGHHDRQNGTYHCHREPCLSQHKQVKKAYSEAISEGRSFSKLYEREEWKHWSDIDNDCQDTREEALIHYSQIPVQFESDRGCNVVSGRWHDPYTNKTFTHPSDLDIDHVVPLGNAHISGGFSWNSQQKEAYANDLFGLIPVDLSANRSKSKRSPDQWMPTNQSYHCDYVAWWVAVKTKYNLSYTAAERDKIHRVNAICNN